MALQTSVKYNSIKTLIPHVKGADPHLYNALSRIDDKLVANTTAQTSSVIVDSIANLSNYKANAYTTDTLFVDKIQGILAVPVGNNWVIINKVELYDTHANRSNYLASTYPLGSIYTESDTGIVYIAAIVSGTQVWKYASGYYTLMQAGILAYKLTLISSDIGTKIYVPYYDHFLVWQGSVFGFAEKENNGYIIPYFAGANTTGFVPCSGGSAQMLNFDGSLATVTLPSISSLTIAAYNNTSSLVLDTSRTIFGSTVTYPILEGVAYFRI